MIISMQGNWTVTVTTKNAAFGQRFIVQGAVSGAGTHNGTVGTSINVQGSNWSIAVQNDPGGGNWLTSATQITTPVLSGGVYRFNIRSNDAGSDVDFDDLILTCSRPENINDFIVYGNVRLYGDDCIFNPCRRFPYVIDTYRQFKAAIKNDTIRAWVEETDPRRLNEAEEDRNPDVFFSPLVFDLTGEATKPNTKLTYCKKQPVEKKSAAKTEKELASPYAASEFELVSTERINSGVQALAPKTNYKLVESIESLFYNCTVEPGANLTLTFEEYDRTAAELAGGPYTGTGNRRLLGNAITDMNGNYIFLFTFDMSFPILEDAADIAAGQNVNVAMYPDVIIKVVNAVTGQVLFESAPYYDIPNLKRIDLCLPASQVQVTAACFNGNLIGSLGTVYIGGSQNINASTAPIALKRYGYSNYLEANGTISVNSTLAGFNVECAAWHNLIDIKGCMYDAAKTAANNKIVWYTIKIRRSTVANWTDVVQTHLHPRYSNMSIPGYSGDMVGPFYPAPGGVLNGTVPAYKNIQRELFVNGIDWEYSQHDMYMKLNTALYDKISGVATPGTFYVRVDGYDVNGNLVPGATDLIALYIHNNGIQFGISNPKFTPLVNDVGCMLYRLTAAQLHYPLDLNITAADPHGFVNNYSFNMNRCMPGPIQLNSNIVAGFTLNGSYSFTSLPRGSNPANVHNACPGYKGTLSDFSSVTKNVVITPPAGVNGWLLPNESFAIYTFGLSTTQRVTNGYNTGFGWGTSASKQLMIELVP